MDDSEKVSLVADFAYATRRTEYKHTTRRGASKTDIKTETRASEKLLTLILGRKPTREETNKVTGVF